MGVPWAQPPDLMRTTCRWIVQRLEKGAMHGAGGARNAMAPPGIGQFWHAFAVMEVGKVRSWVGVKAVGPSKIKPWRIA